MEVTKCSHRNNWVCNIYELKVQFIWSSTECCEGNLFFQFYQEAFNQYQCASSSFLYGLLKICVLITVYIFLGNHLSQAVHLNFLETGNTTKSISCVSHINFKSTKLKSDVCSYDVADNMFRLLFLCCILLHY